MSFFFIQNRNIKLYFLFCAIKKSASAFRNVAIKGFAFIFIEEGKQKKNKTNVLFVIIYGIQYQIQKGFHVLLLL